MPAPNFTTVTLSRGHDLKPGDTIEIQTLDPRWWVRLWYSMLLKPPPYRVEKFTIKDVNHG